MVNETVRILEELLVELKKILADIKKESISGGDPSVFFSEIRKSLFKSGLKQSQVDGINAKLKEMKSLNFPISWMAYTLATSYHETAKRMLPVREGLNASDNWRKKNLRYYPWYGRGDVQLTWETNYKKADKELGLGGALVANPDLALDPDISAKVLTLGMRDGWFSKGKSLKALLKKPIATYEEFRKARPIVNIMDKADLIAGIALRFQDAFMKAGYGG